ncbi:MAG: serine hydrolase [Proteobacteria bacterium]|nr:serine hydrolase [Pseudomonadota bacterium]
MTKEAYNQHGIPQALSDGLLEDNPNMSIVLGEEYGDFALVDKTTPQNKVVFKQNQLAQSQPHNTNKYDIDISGFDGTFRVRDAWSAHPSPIRKNMSTAITVNNGVLDEDACNKGNPSPINRSAFSKEDLPDDLLERLNKSPIAPPISFLDKDGLTSRMAGGIVTPVAGGTTKGDDKLQPTASMGKMFAAAMLIKTFEQLEDSIDEGIESKAAKEKLMLENGAKTLMDVPIAKTAELLNSAGLKKEAAGIGKVMNFLGKIDASDKDEKHANSISPRMLLNQTARIPNSLDWINRDGQTAMGEWLSNENAKFDAATILGEYEPTRGFYKSVEYSNGNTTVAGMLVEAVTGKSAQENLTGVAPGAVIVTSRSDLDELDYTKTEFTSGKRDFGEHTPTDPGYTAGGYMVKPDDMASFSQNYISGELFTRPEYKDYVASSIADSALHPRVQGELYENSLMVMELSKDDPLRKKSGYTHCVGHDGDTPNISTDSFTPVKVEGGKITEVGETQVNMTTRDTRGFERLQKQIKEEKQVKQFDAPDLATMADLSPEVLREAKALGAQITAKPSLHEESKGEEKSSWIDRGTKDNPRVGFNRTPRGSREI